MAFAASEQKAVGLAGFQQGSTDDGTRSSGEIGLGPVLNNPTALLEEEINLLASPFFGSLKCNSIRIFRRSIAPVASS